MKKKFIILALISIILIVFLFLAFFNWDTGNNYMEELRQLSLYPGMMEDLIRKS